MGEHIDEASTRKEKREDLEKLLKHNYIFEICTTPAAENIKQEEVESVLPRLWRQEYQ